jgi:hypothetical protein
VNGLQTTQTLKEYMENVIPLDDERKILVKVIATQCVKLRERVIHATNNQTEVEPVFLRATRKEHLDIEKVLDSYGYFYERRKSPASNDKVLRSHIVTLEDLAICNISLLKRSPSKAVTLRGKHLLKESLHDSIFIDTPIMLWPIMVKLRNAVLKIIDKSLKSNDKYHKNRKRLLPIVMLFVVARKFGRFDYNIHKLQDLRTEEISDEFIEESLLIISKFFSGSVNISKKFIMNMARVKEFCHLSFVEYSIKNPHIVEADAVHSDLPYVDIEVLKKVKSFLPEGLLPRGIHKVIADQVGISETHASDAIRVLKSESPF